MNLWRKLTIDWPCALGDGLWAMLVVAPAALLDRLTWRLALRLTIQLVLLYILIRFFAEIAAAHATFLFTLDAAVYWEAGGTLYVLVARGHAGNVLAATMRVIAAAARGAIRARPRFAGRQRRNARRRGGIPKSSDDEPSGLYAFA